MKLKTSLLSLFWAAIWIIAFCSSSFAQDKIYCKDGSQINAKVTSIGHSTVWYKRPDNLNGPDYGILKKDVAIIIYPDGKTSVFFKGNKADKTSKAVDTVRKTPKAKPVKVHKELPVIDTTLYHYGKNIFSITPAAYTKTIDGTINDFGIGLSYERLLDDRGTISFTLPAMLLFSSAKDFNNSVVVDNMGVYSGYTQGYGSYNSFWFMPGFKVYTGPDTRKLRFAFGASLFCAFGSEPYGVYENVNFSNSPFAAYHYNMYGFMATGSVNIMVSKGFRLSLDLAAGMPISDDRYLNVVGSPSQVLSPFMQVGFKIGYCY